jgi:hypothetical protein
VYISYGTKIQHHNECSVTERTQNVVIRLDSVNEATDYGVKNSGKNLNETGRFCSSPRLDQICDQLVRKYPVFYTTRRSLTVSMKSAISSSPSLHYSGQHS